MPPFLRTYLTPNATAVKFAIKTTLAMMLALYVALAFDVERPYWALISAAFLQIRPMSGMVVEKGICQLGGTALGAWWVSSSWRCLPGTAACPADADLLDHAVYLRRLAVAQ